MSKRNNSSWKKGQSGNPKGRPKLCSDLKQVRDEVRETVIHASALLMQPETKLREMEKSSELTALEGLVIDAITSRNWNVIQNLLDRTLGKPRQESTSDSSPQNVFKLEYRL